MKAVTLDYNGWRKDIMVSNEVFESGVIYFNFYKSEHPVKLNTVNSQNYFVMEIKFYRTGEAINDKYLFKSD